MPVDLAIGLSSEDRDPEQTTDDYVHHQEDLAQESYLNVNTCSLEQNVASSRTTRVYELSRSKSENGCGTIILVDINVAHRT